MATLILLRHASAVSGSDDAARVLTEGGCQEARAVGRRLSQLGSLPDRVLCSTAERARQTLGEATGVVGAMAGVPVDYDSRLYLASRECLVGCLGELPPATERAVVIAHNPGLFDLARSLAGDSEQARQTLSVGFPPACFAVFSVVVPWARLTPSEATLVEVAHPPPVR